MPFSYHILDAAVARQFILHNELPGISSEVWFASRRRLAVEALWVVLINTFINHPEITAITLSVGHQDSTGAYSFLSSVQPNTTKNQQAQKDLNVLLDTLANPENQWAHARLNRVTLTPDQVTADLSEQVSEGWQTARTAYLLSNHLPSMVNKINPKKRM